MEARRKGAAPPAFSRWMGPAGGRYAPLSDSDVIRVHESVLHLLETLGLSNASTGVVERVVARGGRMDDRGRLLFPRTLVEEAISDLNRNVVLGSRREGYRLHLNENRVHTGTGGAAPRILDLETQLYRETTIRDLFDIARVVDMQEHIHFCSRPVVGTDAPDPLTLDINTLYACLQATSKHVCMSITEPGNVKAIAEICYRIAGGEAAFRADPFVTVMATHVVPPMRFATESCEVVEEAVLHGFPVQLISAGQMGATSPVTLAGSVVQAVAESLAGTVFAWLVDPQARAIFAPKPLVSDLRTGAMCGGSGEQAVVMAAATQMGKFYGIPVASIAGYSDAKVHDAQAGYEKNLSVALAANAGCTMISHACGTLASMLGCSIESFIIDNDMLGGVLRSVHGIEVSDETLAEDVIRDVVLGAGHYLGHPQTLQRMESDYIYPCIADRQDPASWTDSGSRDMLDRARGVARTILRDYHPAYISVDVDSSIRRDFEIMLPTSTG